MQTIYPLVMPGDNRLDLMAGTLEMLVLRTLSVESLHGYAIAQHISKLSEGVLQVEQGSLYPALERLLNRGLVTAEWKLSPTRRQARYYKITRAGKKLLEQKTSDYDRLALAIERVMGRA